MWRRRLKPIRVVAALAVLVALTAALVDFRDAVPPSVGHWPAAVQLVPAAIAFANGAGFTAAITLTAILGVTLLFGRLYCSMLCPLGVLQDVIARLAAWRRGRLSRLPHVRPQNALRYGILGLTIAGVAAGWSGLTLALLDPYSHYGRIATGLFRPALVMANNAVVTGAELLELSFLYRVQTPWLGAGALAVPLSVFILVSVLAVRRGRLFCNTACPVGTLLGLVSRRALWRLTLDRSTCIKCGDCLQVCKAQCIDLRKGVIDASRCVACYNCIGVCAEHGIAYQAAWDLHLMETEAEEETEPDREPEPAASCVGGPADPTRRVFLNGAVVMTTAAAGLTAQVFGAAAAPPVVDDNASVGVCPPGAGGIDRYLNRCTACHLCVSACPTHVLRPALLDYGFSGFLRPRLDFTRSFCNYDCRRCGEVCPDGAISLLDLADKQVTRIGRAIFNRELCVVEKDGTDCSACSEHCPTKAVDTVPYRNGLRLPEMKDERCIGCGACEFACPVVPKKAIMVSGRRRHERAERTAEAKPPAVKPATDFPF